MAAESKQAIIRKLLEKYPQAGNKDVIVAAEKEFKTKVTSTDVSQARNRLSKGKAIGVRGRKSASVALEPSVSELNAVKEAAAAAGGMKEFQKRYETIVPLIDNLGLPKLKAAMSFWNQN